MPIRQIRKNMQKLSKQMRSNKTRKYSNKQTKHRGGSTGMPPSYYGNGNSGYYAPGSSELLHSSCSKQNAVSQGILSQSGAMAGPNLYPMMGGKTHKKNNKHNNNHSNHNKRSKHRKNKSQQYLTGSHK